MEIEILRRISNIPAKYQRNFCQTVGSVGGMSVLRQLLLCFVLVSSYLILSSVVLCLHAFRVVIEPPHMWLQIGSVLSAFLWADVPGDVGTSFMKVRGILLLMGSNEWARMGKEATVV